jgi:purine-binding chemotaxis protein CheW
MNKTEEILERRANKISKKKESEIARKMLVTAAIVGVGQEEFAIPADNLIEIVASPEITNLPGLPDWIRGVVQIRGDLLSVVDLLHLLRIDRQEAQPASAYLMVLEGQHGKLGIVLNEIVSFRNIYSDELADSLDSSNTSNSKLFKYVTKDLVTVLDVEELLKDQRLFVDHNIGF